MLQNMKYSSNETQLKCSKHTSTQKHICHNASLSELKVSIDQLYLAGLYHHSHQNLKHSGDVALRLGTERIFKEVWFP